MYVVRDVFQCSMPLAMYPGAVPSTGLGCGRARVPGARHQRIPCPWWCWRLPIMRSCGGSCSISGPPCSVPALSARGGRPASPRRGGRALAAPGACPVGGARACSRSRSSRRGAHTPREPRTSSSSRRCRRPSHDALQSRIHPQPRHRSCALRNRWTSPRQRRTWVREPNARDTGNIPRAPRAGVASPTLPPVTYERTPGAGSAAAPLPVPCGGPSPVRGAYRRHEPAVSP